MGTLTDTSASAWYAVSSVMTLADKDMVSRYDSAKVSLTVTRVKVLSVDMILQTTTGDKS